jgi:hypothetical protein
MFLENYHGRDNCFPANALQSSKAMTTPPLTNCKSLFVLLLVCFGFSCRDTANNRNGDTTHSAQPEATVGASKDSLQNNNNASFAEAIPTDSAIRLIRTAFEQINAAPLQHKDFKWTADNCNADGTATYYLTGNNEIVKVVETGAIGDGSWTTAYYYQQGRFLFSLTTDIGGPAIGPVDTMTIRKYVYNNKVIRTIENDTYTSTADSLLTPASKEYRILEAFKSKNFGAAFCD